MQAAAEHMDHSQNSVLSSYDQYIHGSVRVFSFRTLHRIKKRNYIPLEVYHQARDPRESQVSGR